MLGLTKQQREKFSEILNELPEAQLFDEVGTNEGTSTKSSNTMTEIDNKVQKKMSEDNALQYNDALRQVFAENPKLAEKYNKELEQ